MHFESFPIKEERRRTNETILFTHTFNKKKERRTIKETSQQLTTMVDDMVYCSSRARDTV
ncbi:hypothetical protein EXW62_19815 [Bacillus mycoides]|uniref:hypothetical protein n=1 Tax=Bacillus mycoides TaxID=1405 RepID=UPI001C023335|nr:hypothetical protein [Bacillus mycoides]QWH19218.1 hypothetical protein EXW62_19815 [Bacillus mycoides]